jgi:hypothetical protein
MYKKTTGKRIFLEGLEMYLPPQPKIETIDGYKLPKEKQAWKYYDVNNNEDPLPNWYKELRTAEIEIQESDPFYFDPECEAYREIEWERTANGYWFMNNGEPTYLTGACYFFLRWCRFDIGYSHYLEFIRDNFYFREYCEQDPKCLGYIILKGRGIGGTLEEVCSQLWNMTCLPTNRQALIQSKTELDATRAFTEKTVLVFKNLPHFFQPICSNSDDPKSWLSFSLESAKGVKKKQRQSYSSNTEQLRSRIDVISSGEKAADSRTIHDFICDEMGKTPSAVKVKERHNINKKCVYRFGRKIGILRCPTTVEELEEGRGNKDFEDLWNESNQLYKNTNNNTPSGLYRRFLPIFKTGAYVDNERNFDAYGRVNEQWAKEYYDREALALVHDPREYASFRRKHPNSIEDCFGQHNKDCEFNILILQQAYKALLDNPQKTYRTGYFDWEKKWEKVKWVDSPENTSKWNISYIPDEKKTNLIRKTSFDVHNQVQRLEPIGTNFVLSCDPIAKIKGEGYNSQAGTTVFYHFDEEIDNYEKFSEYVNLDEFLLSEHKYKSEYQFTSHNYIADYLKRPNDPEEFYEDMAMACIYFGAKILIERQTAGIENYFLKHGMHDFVMQRPASSWTSPNLNDFQKCVPSSPKLISMYTLLGKSFVSKHGHRLKLPRIIDSLIHFDSNDTTVHDLAVATLLNQFNISNTFSKLQKKQQEFAISFKTYRY